MSLVGGSIEWTKFSWPCVYLRLSINYFVLFTWFLDECGRLKEPVIKHEAKQLTYEARTQKYVHGYGTWI